MTVSALIPILVLALVIIVILWVIDQLGLPANAALCAKVIVGLVGIIKLFAMIGITI